jgi:hypothetical protein
MSVNTTGTDTSSGTPEVLRRFLEKPKRPSPGERCEMCAEVIPEEHSHVVNLQNRNLMCACRACYLLFTQAGAAQGRYRAVPDRYLYDPAFGLTDEQWDDLQIPVKMAFFFQNSNLDRFVAFYPSPAGSTESLLPLEFWATVMQANPAFTELEPDVEALLLNREPEATECFLVPIDACYELVGRVRLHWRGFSGGEEVWREIYAIFAGLRERSRRVGAGT